MSQLVKYIYLLILLIVIATFRASTQGNTELQETIPQEDIVCNIQTELSTAEKTLNYLHSIRMLFSIQATCEIPAHLQTQSKFRSIHSTIYPNKHKTISSHNNCCTHCNIPKCYHSTGYYIYALEHILI